MSRGQQNRLRRGDQNRLRRGDQNRLRRGDQNRHGPARPGHLNQHRAATGGPDEPGHDVNNIPGHDVNNITGGAS
jgi:hypothetical protein